MIIVLYGDDLEFKSFEQSRWCLMQFGLGQRRFQSHFLSHEFYSQVSRTPIPDPADRKGDEEKHKYEVSSRTCYRQGSQSLLIQTGPL